MTKAKTRDQQLLDSRQECDYLKTLLQQANEKATTARQEMAAAKESEKDTTDKFNDMKVRLFDAEIENHRLRGYIQRVQEDDIVREDVLTVGEPGGEQQIVPKRKHTAFIMPVQQTEFGSVDRAYSGGYSHRERKTSHWITY